MSVADAFQNFREMDIQSLSNVEQEQREKLNQMTQDDKVLKFAIFEFLCLNHLNQEFLKEERDRFLEVCTTWLKSNPALPEFQ